MSRASADLPLRDVQRRAISHTPLDAAHVASTDVGEIGKFFLRYVALRAEVANSGAEPLQDRVFGRLPGLPGHGPDARSLHPIEPRPIGYNGGESTCRAFANSANGATPGAGPRRTR